MTKFKLGTGNARGAPKSVKQTKQAKKATYNLFDGPAGTCARHVLVKGVVLA